MSTLVWSISRLSCVLHIAWVSRQQESIRVGCQVKVCQFGFLLVPRDSFSDIYIFRNPLGKFAQKMTSTVTNGSGDKAGLLSSATGVEEESNVVGTSFSLVRYNNPVLIDKHSETPSITPSTSGKYFCDLIFKFFFKDFQRQKVFSCQYISIVY